MGRRDSLLAFTEACSSQNPFYLFLLELFCTMGLPIPAQSGPVAQDSGIEPTPNSFDCILQVRYFILHMRLNHFFTLFKLY